jgi:ribosomal subunit interface protein
MAIDLRVTYRDFSPPMLAEERIQKRVKKLERLFPRIVSCHVVASELHRAHKKGALYNIHLDVVIPGHELAAAHDRHDRHSHQDFYVALRDAFDALERQLHAHTERKRADVPVHEIILNGHVTKLFPDYGFIETLGGEEYYFHANAVMSDQFEKLTVGRDVRFAAAEEISEFGAHAISVRLIKKHA